MNVRSQAARPWQFTLKAFLATVAVLVVYFSYLVHLEARRTKLVQAIENVGGRVTKEDSLWCIFPYESVTEVAIPHGRLHEIGAWKLRSFPHLAALRMTDVVITTNEGLSVTAAEVRITHITDDMLNSTNSMTK